MRYLEWTTGYLVKACRKGYAPHKMRSVKSNSCHLLTLNSRTDAGPFGRSAELQAAAPYTCG